MEIEKFVDLDEKTAQFMLEQGEKHLDAQRQAFHLGHRRALILGPLLLAIGNALLLYSLQMWSEKEYIIFYTGIFSSIYILIFSFLCFYTVRPTVFSYPGNNPAKMIESKADSFKIILNRELNLCDNYITRNDIILGRIVRTIHVIYVGISIFPVILIIFWIIITMICQSCESQTSYQIDSKYQSCFESKCEASCSPN